MNVAVYARKSHEQHGVPDEVRSVTRQVAQARAFAEARGWTVAPEHVYLDDGISGALFGAARPGLARLLNALRPRPPFQALIVMEEERVGREAIETSYTLKQLTDAGVRVFSYLTGQERTLRGATDKVMLALATFAGEMERERASQRGRDAMERKAKAGHVTGGRVFGYTNVRADGHTERRIDAVEAETIRQIFAAAARGVGYYTIATQLNRDGAPTPRSGSWSRGAVRDVLRRELYRGRIVWGREAREVRGGRAVIRVRPADEQVTVEAPELRIVSEADWATVQARLAGTRAVYAGRAAKATNGTASRFLLTGYLACGLCHGALTATNGRSFICSVYHNRGRAACTNNTAIHMGALDAAVLAAVESTVLNVAVLETALAKAWDQLRAPADDGDGDRTATLRAELAQLDGEVARLAEAIATGASWPRSWTRSRPANGAAVRSAARSPTPSGGRSPAATRTASPGRSRPCGRRSRTGGAPCGRNPGPPARRSGRSWPAGWSSRPGSATVPAGASTGSRPRHGRPDHRRGPACHSGGNPWARRTRQPGKRHPRSRASSARRSAGGIVESAGPRRAPSRRPRGGAPPGWPHTPGAGKFPRERSRRPPGPTAPAGRGRPARGRPRGRPPGSARCARCGVEPVLEGRLRHQRQRVRLLLAEGRRVGDRALPGAATPVSRV